MQLEAIEARVAYPARTFDDDYLETLYGMVCLLSRPVFVKIYTCTSLSLLISMIKRVYKKICPIRSVSEYYDSPLSLQFQFNDNTYFENAINYQNISTRQQYSLLYQPVDRTL